LVNLNVQFKSPAAATSEALVKRESVVIKGALGVAAGSVAAASAQRLSANPQQRASVNAYRMGKSKTAERACQRPASNYR
jgi:hypothetical protein